MAEFIPRPQRIFHHIKLIGVHHGGLSVGVFALEIPVIVGVDMAVEEKFRLIFFHQSAEYGETLMRKIGKVVKPGGGSVGDKDIKTFVTP